MPRKGANISLSSYDDIFETDESRADSQLEKVQKIPISELVPFKNHPFKVIDDEAMLRTTESIAQFGVLTPLIARPLEDGGYEIISGHRRAHAAEAAGLTEVPVIVRDMDDDAATVLMVDSNLQRENILPSERAFAYKMKLEAIKRKAGRPSKENPRQVVGNLESAEIIGKDNDESGRQVQRFIRLTNLIPELLDMVDQKQISFNPAVELSYLTPEEQQHVIEAMDFTQAAPSLSQAQRLKKLSQEGGCTLEAMQDILGEVKKGDLERVAFKSEQLRKYFPKSYTPKQMSDTIIKLLEQWQKKRQRDQER
ncbi:MAG: ParB/RepB/Spo0J family partition protein [Clostridia bacterium]|nr:ParB/RepB/Spo0J family partition protein [Clostridia bacterium]